MFDQSAQVDIATVGQTCKKKHILETFLHFVRIVKNCAMYQTLGEFWDKIW